MSERSPRSADNTSSKSRRSVVIILAVTLTLGVIGFFGWRLADSPDLSYRRGREALIQGDHVAVEREIDRLYRTAGTRSRGCLLKGLLLSRAGRPAEAIEWLDQAARDESLAVEASTEAARCFYSMGRHLEAIEAAQAALAQNAEYLDARRWLAAAYYDLGAVPHAIVELKHVSAEAVDDPRPDRLLGLISKDSEKYHAAIEHYRESLRRDPLQPDAPMILLELAESLVKIGKFEEALVTLKDCEKSSAALTWEAECLVNLSRSDEALGRLKEAVALDPAYFPAKLAYGKRLLDGGFVEQAIDVLSQASQLMPQNSQARFQLSQALRRGGKVEQADVELERMREAQALERQFSDLHDQAANQPNDAEIRYHAGELAIKLGKPELGKLWLRAALAINPHYEKARAMLLRLEK